MKVYGEWLDLYNNKEWAMCSACGNIVAVSEASNTYKDIAFIHFKKTHRYCFNCGAKMDYESNVKEK